jgi:uncharacterized protein (TIGR00299 family) protein
MIAYFDCFSGISGDMTLGALIDLGVPSEWLKDSLINLPLSGFDLSVDIVHRHGVHAKHARVAVLEHDHPRHYSDIISLIEQSRLKDSVKERSLNIFDRIATAESHIHGCSKESVHFHEVGAVDAIVDIVGTALCVDYLKIDRVVSSHIPLGKGFVSCQHGTLPVPAPATVEILKGIPVYGTDIPHELVTPTGAAVISSLADRFEPIPGMEIEGVGYGAGTRDLEHRPNLLRVLIGRNGGSEQSVENDRLLIVETCIDDMNPEVFGFLMEQLFEDGVLDVFWIPVFMKKNRPGTMVQVLCRLDQKEMVCNRIFKETTTIGIRYYEAARSILTRKNIEIETAFGTVAAKKVTHPDGSIRVAPEYEACKRIALEKNIPLRVVYEHISKEAE